MKLKENVRRKKRGPALHLSQPAPREVTAGSTAPCLLGCHFRGFKALLKVSYWEEKPGTASSSAWSYRSCPFLKPPCGRNPIISWCQKLAFSKTLSKSDLGRSRKAAYRAIPAQEPRLSCSSCAHGQSRPAFSEFLSPCCFPQLLKQKQDGAASEEGWSPASQIEPGQGEELGSLHHLIGKVNKSKQHLIY